MTRPHRGLFLAIEGPDGVGKGELVKRLVARLQQVGLEVLQVREPGGTPVAERIRAVLRDPDLPHIDGETALLLFSASRRDLLQTVVRPALDAGLVVVTDRCALSTFVYQGAQGVAPDVIRQVTLVAAQDCWPDLTLVLSARPEVVAARIGGRAGEVDQFEAAVLGDPARVDARYREAAAMFRDCTVVDASGTPDEVMEGAWRELAPVVEAMLSARGERLPAQQAASMRSTDVAASAGGPAPRVSASR